MISQCPASNNVFLKASDFERITISVLSVPEIIQHNNNCDAKVHMSCLPNG